MTDDKMTTSSAKILLFGEYTVLLNNQALSIPYAKLSGDLRMAGGELNDVQRGSNKDLADFHDFMHSVRSTWKKPFSIDLEQMGEELKQGLYFDCNIPVGYGLGSSGALVAAVYRKYGKQKGADYFVEQGLLKELQIFFASIEAFFHGKSSGLDPLVSFIGSPLQLRGEKDIRIVTVRWDLHTGKGGLFLVDSGTLCETGPLVSNFRERYEDPGFRKLILDQYMPLVNAAISHYVNSASGELLSTMRDLSAFQLENFGHLIPEEMAILWKSGLENGLYAMKLCGSGGGGMFLGFTADMERTAGMIREHPVMTVHRL